MKKDNSTRPQWQDAVCESQAVNFREIRMGHIAPNTLYRSSHPIKGDKQEKAISLLASKVRIRTVINLCDKASKIALNAIFASWYDRLFKNGSVIALGMDFSVTSETFKRKLKEALQFIIETEGPWLIHCHAGIDRTGFVCMVLESFMGAKLDDVINDYLCSFNSVFTSSVYTSQKADSKVALQILSVMSDSQIIDEQNLQHIAENYLLNTIKMTCDELNLLFLKLSNVIGRIKSFRTFKNY